MELRGAVAQGIVPWRSRPLEVVLVAVGALTILVALVVAVWSGKPEWFQRASAVPLVASGWLAYRSLRRSYEKVRNAHLRLIAAIRQGDEFPGWIEASMTQRALDGCTLVLLLIGTAMASFGDVIAEWVSPW